MTFTTVNRSSAPSSVRACLAAVLSGVAVASFAADGLDAIAVPPTPQPISLGTLDWQLSGPGIRREDDLIIAELGPGQAEGESMAKANLDLSAYEGHCVRLRIHAKGEGLGTPAKSWLGLKFMVRIVPVEGKTAWPGTPHRLGDWEDDLSFVFDLEPFGKLNTVTLNLGIQKAQGRAVFDLSTLRAEDCGVAFPLVNQDFKVRYSPKISDAPRARGVMLPGIADKIVEDDFATLEEWGANLVRYQMMCGFLPKGDPGWDDLVRYDARLEKTLVILETRILPLAEKHGQRVVVDLHQTPGGRNARGENRMLYEKRFAARFVEIWKHIAARFKDDGRIFGYDLVNEPKQLGPAPYSFLHLQRAAAQAIRAIDPDATIIVAANGMGQPDGFRTLSPLAMDNILYTTHCYAPMDYTHQGIHDRPREAFLGYPNPEKGWDKDSIREALAPVLEFSKKHNARIYVGEFSAITWAPGADVWIRDCIDVLEEYGWDWSYHAFREWDGWSVEKTWAGSMEKLHVFVDDPDTPRKRALLDGFAR